MSEKRPIISSKRLQQTQAQVNEVVDIMRVNVDKVLERDKNLSELDGRAGSWVRTQWPFDELRGNMKELNENLRLTYSHYIWPPLWLDRLPGINETVSLRSVTQLFPCSG
ncbi:unnamed protein product [Dicrocoelium dendriticum]|nr:unnamed protein product [Dicrocoelium dendriticum]